MQIKSIIVPVTLTLIIIGGLLSIFFTGGQGLKNGIGNGGARLQDTPPVVEHVRFSSTPYGAGDLTTSGIVPSLGADRTIYVAGVVSDPNGEDTIASISLVFHRSSLPDSCAADKNNCYRVSNCSIDTTYGNSTEAGFSCGLSLAYWIDATDSTGRYAADSWVAQVDVIDQSTFVATGTASVEVNSLIALDFPETLDYGTRVPREESTADSNIEMLLTQKGNTALSLNVQGSPMNCSVAGFIPVQNQRWALTDVGYAAPSAHALTSISAPTSRNIALRNDDTNAQEGVYSLYWNIGIPATGVKGSCAGANTLSFVANRLETGYVMDARLANVAYTSPGASGRTSSDGAFNYYPGDVVSFTIGAVTLGSIDTNRISVDKKVTTADLLGLPSHTDIDDKALLGMTRFLQALNSDPSSESSTVISDFAHELLTEPIDFSTASDELLTMRAREVYPRAMLPSIAKAQEHLVTTYAVENIASYATRGPQVSSARGPSTAGTLNWPLPEGVRLVSPSADGLTAQVIGGGSFTAAANTLVVPSITFSSASSTLAYNTATTLSWSTSGAATCTASGGWSGSKATSGSQSTGNLTTTTTFTLACSSSLGIPMSASVIVAVVPDPTISISAASTLVASGAATTLTWSTTNALTCTASGGWSGSKATSGSGVTTGNLTTETTFTLTCVNSVGVSKSSSVTVTPVGSPSITLNAALLSVASGAATTLTWSTNNADTCTASGGWSGAKETSGLLVSTGNLIATTDFTLTCTNSVGVSTDSTVTVTVIPDPTISFAAASSSVGYNTATTLTWSTTNASTCTASGGWSGSKATSGSGATTGTLASSTVFSLLCTSSVGVSVSASVTVTVVSNPTLTFSVATSTIAYNTATTLTWSTTNASTCTASGGWSGSKATSGSGVSTGNLATSSVLTLTCANSVGVSTSSSVTVTVVPDPTITIATADTSVAFSTATTLTWSTTNASTCTASGGWSGSKATSGSGVSTGNLATTTTFTLSCVNSLGVSATSSTVVDVVPGSIVARHFDAAGGMGGAAIQTNGTLWRWGANASGQVGNGTVNSPVTSPVQVGSASDWVNVSASTFDTFGIRSDGTLWAWGANANSQLGVGTSASPLLLPTQVGTATDWRDVSTGGPPGSGAFHTLGIRTNGLMYAWGTNSSGQLGLGDLDTRTEPVQVGTDTWIAIDAGPSHSLAIRSDGTLWATGRNHGGQLGVGDTTNRTVFTQVGTDTNWSKIATGGLGGISVTYSAGVRTDGTLWLWGSTIGSSPVQVGTGTNWTDVAIGGTHYIALRSDGTVWTWGSNAGGATGQGTTTGTLADPTQVGSVNSWIGVTAGGPGGVSGGFSFALNSDGTLWGWGLNTSGQIGQGNTTSPITPVQIGTLNVSLTYGGEGSHFAEASPAAPFASVTSDPVLGTMSQSQAAAVSGVFDSGSTDTSVLGMVRSVLTALLMDIFSR